MTIKANIAEKIEELKQEREEMQQLDPPDQIGEKNKKLKDMAIAAILGEKEDYIAYMKLFAKTPEELARLIPTDGTDNEERKREARAYLVSNAICAPGTTTLLLENVFGKLDEPPAA